MSNILFLKNKRIFCKCEKLENKVKIIKIGEEENIIDVEKFFDYDYFKKLLEYGKELISIHNYNEWFSQNIITHLTKERERVIDIFTKMCNECGFIVGYDKNLNGHNKITLGINDINRICVKIIKLYLIYNIYVSKNEDKYLLEKFNINLLNEFNKNNDYTKLEMLEEYGLLLYSYDIYVLFMYVILDEYIGYKRERDYYYQINKFICPKCKRPIKVTNGNIGNRKMCDRCREKENKKNRNEYQQKRRIINKLVGYTDIVTNISNFDMKEFDVYIHSLTNKKKDVEKKNLKELKDYLNKVEKIIKDNK